MFDKPTKISATRGIYGFFSIFHKKLYENPYQKKVHLELFGTFCSIYCN